MRKAILLLGILGIWGILFVKSVFAVYEEGRSNLEEFVPGEVIVKYKEGEAPADLERAAAAREARGQTAFGAVANRIQEINFRVRGQGLPEEILGDLDKLRNNFGVKSEEGNARGFYLVAVDEKIPIGLLLSRFGSLENVELVEPNYLYYIMNTPNDPYFSQLWGLKNIGAESAWDSTVGDESVKAAVVDSGIDPEHIDLAGNVLEFRDFAGCRSYSTGHGTHTSGTVGAVGANEIGVVGVNWKVSLILANVGCGTSMSIERVARGIDWAVEKGARVVNLSLGGAYSANMASAIANADSKGVIVAAAAGNTTGPYADSHYPASDPKVVTVSAVGPDDRLASYSSYGNSVDLAAPGGNPPAGSGSCDKTGWTDCIGSTILNNQYEAAAGTSMAAPHVTGLVALIWSANSGLSAGEVKQIIYDTAVDLGESGKDIRFGNGRINAAAAIAAAGEGAAPPTSPSPSPSSSPSPSVSPSPSPTQPQTSPTPIEISCPVNGDYNADNSIDLADFEEWKSDFLAGASSLSCFEYWRRASFVFGI